MAKQKSGEPVYLDSISKPKDIEAKVGTNFNALKLPKELSCKFTDGETADLPISWAYGKYDSNVKGVVVLIGRAALPINVDNPRQIEARINVKLV